MPSVDPELYNDTLRLRNSWKVTTLRLGVIASPALGIVIGEAFVDFDPICRSLTFLFFVPTLVSGFAWQINEGALAYLNTARS